MSVSEWKKSLTCLVEVFVQSFFEECVCREKLQCNVDFIVRSVKLAPREFPFVLCWPSAKRPGNSRGETEEISDSESLSTGLGGGVGSQRKRIELVGPFVRDSANSQLLRIRKNPLS